MTCPAGRCSHSCHIAACQSHTLVGALCRNMLKSARCKNQWHADVSVIATGSGFTGQGSSSESLLSPLCKTPRKSAIFVPTAYTFGDAAAEPCCSELQQLMV